MLKDRQIKMEYAFKKTHYKILISILDLFGDIIFTPLRIFKKNPPANPKSILVVRLDHIGDFVCTTPLFKNIKSRFPEAKITALINSASKDLAYRNPNIDKVITFSPFYLKRGERSSTFKGLMRVAKDVRNIGFDLGIEPRGDLLSILIMWLGGVKYRIGYGITGGGFLLNKMCRYDESKHVVDRNLALLEALDIPAPDRSAEVYFNEKDEDEVMRLLRPVPEERSDEWYRARNDNFVVLHPFAGARAKEWPKENFQNLINRIKKDGRDVLLIGSANDEGRYENVIDLRGKLTLPQLACLIKKTGLFVGLDSGPANIAAALNVPSVIICSGTNAPQLWIPNNPNVKFIYKDT
ncbi:MAG: glycosyltransferase family 9 protein, partial [Candidatus Omnitrophica bacterium]|nr:glycosyltransferase family 9 protein [Candidatus Omnitrophota bacterium]